MNTSLAIAIAGILLLLLLSTRVQPTKLNIEELENNEKRYVEINARVEKIYERESGKIIILRDETAIVKAYCKCKQDMLELTKGKRCSFTGRFENGLFFISKIKC